MIHAASSESLSVAASAELQELAKELEELVQRLLLAEQSLFTREVSRYGLTVPQYVTLAALERFADGRERMGVIAREARQCSATMTGIVDRLEHMGLVRRLDDSSDRRSKLVMLTEDGRSRLETVRQARQQRLERILKDIPDDLRAQTRSVMERYASLVETSLE
jgi:DNA-binding MarR family transcriptional regulator